MQWGCNPVGVVFVKQDTQGSSCLATLGWEIQPLWGKEWQSHEHGSLSQDRAWVGIAQARDKCSPLWDSFAATLGGAILRIPNGDASP
jgi:hypothetical protein